MSSIDIPDLSVRTEAEDEATKYVRLQVARWHASVSEAEELLELCSTADEKLQELTERCRNTLVPLHKNEDAHGGTRRKSLNLDPEQEERMNCQEAVIRSRIENNESKIQHSQPKTQQERRMEMLELRRELETATGGGLTGMVDEDAVSTQRSGAASTPRRGNKSITDASGGVRKKAALSQSSRRK
eukprot:TRINITY_DN8181_c1_g2_i1.p1 TRINITY_DN8181_c1_g2~~TRINITY_DN8181_c1_g2_i1.p1  ORF type:complete len:186 (+),score=38.97 TRINITY_DN8181_c1_g2_i1:127-684(+)